jgi:hypothetical protein
MDHDLGRLRVKRVIVHEVPYHLATGASSEPVLSEVESPLDQEVRNFFRERIAGSLGSSAYDVEFNGSTTSPLPRLVLDGLSAKTTTFVAMSQEMARHLYLCQKGNSLRGYSRCARSTLPATVGLRCLSSNASRVLGSSWP